MFLTPTHVSRSLAALVIAVGGLSLAGCNLLVPASSGSGGGAAPDTSASAPADNTGDDVFSIKVGDCLNDGGVTGTVGKVPIVECTAAHDSEAYSSANAPDGDFPGDEGVGQLAEAQCGPAFEQFIGLTYDQSAYDYTYYVPTKESWAAGDRVLMCIAKSDSGEKITGSLKSIKK